MDELQLQTIGLYAGQVVTVPDPVEADGTIEGTNPGDEDIPLPKPEDLITDYTTPEGQSIKYHVSTDIIGITAVEEELDTKTNIAEDPFEEKSFVENVASLYLQTFVKLWHIEVALIISDILAVWACAAWEKNPAWWPAIAIVGGVWTSAFIAWLVLSLDNVCSNTDDAFERFWVILALGITAILGFAVADFLKDLGSYLIKKGINQFTEFFLNREGPSLTWILFKLTCALFVFVAAGTVLTWTLTGLI